MKKKSRVKWSVTSHIVCHRKDGHSLRHRGSSLWIREKYPNVLLRGSFYECWLISRRYALPPIDYGRCTIIFRVLS